LLAAPLRDVFGPVFCVDWTDVFPSRSGFLYSPLPGVVFQPASFLPALEGSVFATAPLVDVTEVGEH
jgi:hypothetical protein